MRKGWESHALRTTHLRSPPCTSISKTPHFGETRATAAMIPADPLKVPVSQEVSDSLVVEEAT